MKLKTINIIPRLISKIKRDLSGAFNKIIYSQTCKKFGAGTRFQNDIIISTPNNVSIGDRCLLSAGIRASSETKNGTLCIEDDVQINYDVILDYTGNLLIGQKTLISEGCVIYTHDHGLNPRSKPNPIQKKIEKNTWIGAHSIILSSCKFIGEGSIIGAGSVVTKDIPANVIAAGNPAKIIRHLNK